MFENKKTAHIKRLKNIQRMQQHIQWNNLIFCIKLIKLEYKMITMSVKNQKLMSSDCRIFNIWFKNWLYLNLKVLIIQSLSLTAIVQFNDRFVFSNYAVWYVLLVKIIIKGSTQSAALIVSMTIIHFWFSDCTRLECECLSACVITFTVIIMLILKPVSLKL